MIVDSFTNYLGEVCRSEFSYYDVVDEKADWIDYEKIFRFALPRLMDVVKETVCEDMDEE